MKFSIQDFFSNYDQIRSFLRIWSQLLKKSWMEDFIFCAVLGVEIDEISYLSIYDIVLRRRNSPWKNVLNKLFWIRRTKFLHFWYELDWTNGIT